MLDPLCCDQGHCQGPWCAQHMLLESLRLEPLDEGLKGELLLCCDVKGGLPTLGVEVEVGGVDTQGSIPQLANQLVLGIVSEDLSAKPPLQCSLNGWTAPLAGR